MPIPITCPKCQANGFVPDQALHQSATCPICQTTFPIKESAGVPVRGDWVDPMTVAPEVPAMSLPVPQAEEPPGTEAWIRSERVQFDAYVAGQLAKLERQRRDNADAESRQEATCIQRSMELNRQAALVDHRRKELDGHEAAYRTNEAALKARADDVDRKYEELAAREAFVTQLETHKNELQKEAMALSALVAELRPLVEQLELRKTEAQTIQAELKSRQAALDRRLLEVGRNEVAIQKRMTEIQELERTLQEELESREADLERQRAMLLEEVRALRSRLPVDTTTPTPRSLPALTLPKETKPETIPSAAIDATANEL